MSHKIEIKDKEYMWVVAKWDMLMLKVLEVKSGDFLF